ncbi:MAG: thioesterase family protein [Nitrospiraceae bacterium]
MHIKIYYEDTDCGGVVYYANYLKYFERARTECLAAKGISVADHAAQGTQFVVIHAEAHYRAPARYGETLRIETLVTMPSRARLTFQHRIFGSASDRPIVEGQATLVPTDAAGRPKRLEPGFVQQLLGT